MRLSLPPSELLMPTFGAHFPGIPKQRRAQGIFPIAAFTDSGFDLEYSPLLVMNRLIIDRLAYEYVRYEGYPYLAPMRRSILALEDAGMLRIVEYVRHATEVTEALEKRVDRLLHDPLYWLPSIRKTWSRYLPELRQQIARFGRHADPSVEGLFFGVYCYLLNGADRIDFDEAAALHKLLFKTAKSRLRAVDVDLIRELIRPLMRQVCLNHLLSARINAPFLDWSDFDDLHQLLGALDWSAKPNDTAVTSETLAAVRQLFTVAIPNLRPGNIDSVIRFIANKHAVRALQQALAEALHEGRDFDHRWADEVRDGANRELLTAHERQKWFRWARWLNVAAGPLAPVGELVKVLAEAGLEAVEGFSEHRTGRRMRRRYEWYFELLRNEERHQPATPR